MIDQLLTQLGFSDKEIIIYLTILKQGKTTPVTLSTTTGINRTTVYSVAKELVKKGVIAEDLAGNNTFFVARSPKELEGIVSQEKSNLDKKEKVVKQAINELFEVSQQTKYSIPKITFIPEEDMEKFLYKRAPVWNESMNKYDKIWWGFQDPSLVKSYVEWIDWYWKQEQTKMISLKFITNQNNFEKEVAQRNISSPEQRQFKYWPDSKNFTASTWAIGDFVVSINTSQSPHYLIEIYDEVLAHNMRELFKGIWENLNQKNTST